MDNRKNLAETYYGRIVRLKPIIESSSEIMDNILSVFSHLYFGGNLNNNVNEIGRGQIHILHNVGKIEDSINKRKVHIATRMFREEPYTMEEPVFKENLHKFEDAFNGNKNPPYFCGIVTFEDLLAGMILEDVSENKKFELKGEPNKMYFTRTGDYKRFFLDPVVVGYDGEAEHYLNEEAIINVKNEK